MTAAEEAEKLKNKAETSVKEANETLDAIMVEVNKLGKDDLVEVRATNKPSAIAVLILGAVVYLM